MEYVEAVCPNCSAIFSVDPDQKSAFCAHCGGRTVVVDAIRRFAKMYPDRVKAKEEEQASEQAEKKEEQAPPEPEKAEEPGLPDPLEEKMNTAAQHLTLREYAKAAEIYDELVAENPQFHQGWWQLFACEERNFNFEEKILQTFSCYGFAGGTERMRRDILENRFLLEAIKYAPTTQKADYLQAATKHADRVFSTYREGVDNLNQVIQKNYGLLCQTWETIGISSPCSKVGLASAIPVRFMGDRKFFFRFLSNNIKILHLDVINNTPDPAVGTTMEHYRHLRLEPEQGNLLWGEYRRFFHLDTADRMTGEFDIYQKAGWALLGLWNDRLIIRHGNVSYYCRSCTLPDWLNEATAHCYEMFTPPIVEDPNSYNAGKKVSEYYHVQPISTVFESNRKSRWLKKNSGCYIATAVYGDYDAPQVRVLRRFRDEVLLHSIPGRLFVRIYYLLSPPMARHLPRAVRPPIRKLLDRMVRRLTE